MAQVTQRLIRARQERAELSEFREYPRSVDMGFMEGIAQTILRSNVGMSSRAKVERVYNSMGCLVRVTLFIDDRMIFRAEIEAIEVHRFVEAQIRVFTAFHAMGRDLLNGLSEFIAPFHGSQVSPHATANSQLNLHANEPWMGFELPCAVNVQGQLLVQNVNVALTHLRFETTMEIRCNPIQWHAVSERFLKRVVMSLFSTFYIRADPEMFCVMFRIRRLQRAVRVWLDKRRKERNWQWHRRRDACRVLQSAVRAWLERGQAPLRAKFASL